MKTVPLTVLVYEGPMAYAYLAAMREAGMRPERIVQMVLDHHPASKKPIARWLPKGLRLKLAAKTQHVSLHYWSNWLDRKLPELTEQMKQSIGSGLGMSRNIMDAVTGKEPLSAFCDDVSRILVSGYDDPLLKKTLERLGKGAILYTGGGILPSDVLNIPGVRFIHVHPGFLPDVRGADGLLWSLLTRSKVGVSSFYMAPGIDTGEIILAREYEAVTISLGEQIRTDDDMLYRAVFSLYDPVLRAKALLEMLALGDSPDAYPSHSQDVSKGTSFHFMHASIRKSALNKLFLPKKPEANLT